MLVQIYEEEEERDVYLGLEAPLPAEQGGKQGVLPRGGSSWVSHKRREKLPKTCGEHQTLGMRWVEQMTGVKKRSIKNQGEIQNKTGRNPKEGALPRGGQSWVSHKRREKLPKTCGEHQTLGMRWVEQMTGVTQQHHFTVNQIGCILLTQNCQPDFEFLIETGKNRNPRWLWH